jgi:putative thioredoxin
MNAANYIVDVGEGNAQTLLIEESLKRPVVVDFWADWCGPCKQLMPILEKLAAEYQGAFLLAKVNADEQQMLAQQLGVRSLPTVMIIKDGQPVDGFSGAQPESAVRDMLDKHVPSPQIDALAEAEQLLAEGDIPGALALYRGAWEDSGQKPEFTHGVCRRVDCLLIDWTRPKLCWRTSNGGSGCALRAIDGPDRVAAAGGAITRGRGLGSRSCQ